MKNPLGLASFLLLVACGGATVPIGEIDPAGSDAGVTGSASDAGFESDASYAFDAGVVDLPDGAAPSVPRECELPSSSLHAFTSVDDVRARITGRWRICYGSVWSPSDAAGIEIGSNEAHFLVVSGTALVRGPTVQYDRVLSVLASYGGAAPGTVEPFYQIDMEAPGVGGNSYSAIVTETGQQMQLTEGTSFRMMWLVRLP